MVVIRKSIIGKVIIMQEPAGNNVFLLRRAGMGGFKNESAGLSKKGPSFCMD